MGDEDCLYLNIWAPNMSAEQISSQTSAKPVMVWIHGGGNTSGTANSYQAHHLAGEKDVVVVLINYRLGLLGWFSHNSIRETSSNPEDASGNFGTLDIIAALKWVQSNIAAFGGDPNRVTIFGESAGGRNVYSMLASPLAKGLFHGAISQSGSTDTTPLVLAEEFPGDDPHRAFSGLINSSNGLIEMTLKKQHPTDSSDAIRRRMASTSSEAMLNQLREIDARSLMHWAADNVEELDYIRVARVVRDGHVIPKQSLQQSFQNPANYNAVPLMAGANRDENKFFMASKSPACRSG